LLRAVLIFVLAAALVWLGVTLLPRMGGRYMLRNSDHDEVMVVDPVAEPAKTVSVLFVGNSLTFVNDLPAMLVNIASSDRANITRLEVKAVTYPGADLNYMRAATGALAWAQTHHVDYVVLQERSGWYETQAGFDFALKNASDWIDVLRPLNEAPLLFEVWSDGAGSTAYSDKSCAAFGKTVQQDASDAAASTENLGRQLGLPVVAVGTAFEQARHIEGAPDVVGPDRHHPSVAGTYLAALVFYKRFTGRSGAEATYRPWGLSQADAAALVEASGN
jgi:hypothetical protein